MVIFVTRSVEQVLDSNNHIIDVVTRCHSISMMSRGESKCVSVLMSRHNLR